MILISISLLTIFLLIKINGEIKKDTDDYSVNLSQKINLPYNLYPDLKQNFVTDKGLYGITSLAVTNWSNIINNNNNSIFVFNHYPPNPEFTKLTNIYWSRLINENQYPIYITANHLLMSIIEHGFINIQFCYKTRRNRDGTKSRSFFIVKKRSCNDIYL